MDFECQTLGLRWINNYRVLLLIHTPCRQHLHILSKCVFVLTNGFLNGKVHKILMNIYLVKLFHIMFFVVIS